MARSMDHADFDTLTRKSVAILNEVVDRASLRHRHSDPLRLHIEFFIQEPIRVVNSGRRWNPLLQVANRSDVVDVRMRANDLLRRQPMLCETLQNFFCSVSRINDDRFTGLLVAQNRAVTLEPSYRKRFDDHLAL